MGASGAWGKGRGRVGPSGVLWAVGLEPHVPGACTGRTVDVVDAVCKGIASTPVLPLSRFPPGRGARPLHRHGAGLPCTFTITTFSLKLCMQLPFQAPTWTPRTPPPSPWGWAAWHCSRRGPGRGPRCCHRPSWPLARARWASWRCRWGGGRMCLRMCGYHQTVVTAGTRLQVTCCPQSCCLFPSSIIPPSRSARRGLRQSIQ